MNSELIVLGLILDFIGVAVLVSTTLFVKEHQIYWPWTPKKRYYSWVEWVVVFKWPPQLKERSNKRRFLPPKHLWNSIGFAIIGLGFILQIIGNLR